MTQIEAEKLGRLKDFFTQCGNAAVAFSGGVDSAFLAKAAHEALGEKMLAITLISHSFPEEERVFAAEFCKNEGISQLEIEYDELSIPGFAENSKERCYFCKKEIFKQIKETAFKKGFTTVCEGSNLDDLGDYRPGLKAIKELGVKSPLQIVELTKQEIRNISKEYGLKTWNKPSSPCLATRFAYGEKITREKLVMVEQAEHFLHDLGFNQLRVRVHGTIARIELLPQDFEKFMQEKIRVEVNEKFKKIGFSYVTLDIQGFRSGSMNDIYNNYFYKGDTKKSKVKKSNAEI